MYAFLKKFPIAFLLSHALLSSTLLLFPPGP